MTVSSTSTKDTFTLTGAGTGFTFTSKIFIKADLVVIRRDTAGVETTLDLTTHYTIAGTSWPTGGTITTVTNYTDGTLIIKAVLPKTQAYDYVTADKFPAASHENNLDRAVLLIQDLYEIASRIPQLEETSTFSGLTMPDPVANYLVGFNAGGTDLEVKLITDASTTVITAYAATLLNAANAAAARVILDSASLTVTNVFTKTNYWKLGSSVASASTVTLPTDGNIFHLTGTTSVNDFTHITGDGPFIVICDAATPLVHLAGTLEIPGKANLTTEVDDRFVLVQDGTTWVITEFTKASGIPNFASQMGGEYIKLSDVKAANTAGGTFTLGAWRTRTLNTEDHDTGGNCTLSSNQFTLAAGTYRIQAIAPAYIVNRHRAKLYNISDSADVILGGTQYANSTDGHNISVVSGEFTIATSKTFEIRHRSQATQATSGFGIQANFGDTEVYCIVELWKVKS